MTSVNWLCQNGEKQLYGWVSSEILRTINQNQVFYSLAIPYLMNSNFAGWINIHVDRLFSFWLNLTTYLSHHVTMSLLHLWPNVYLLSEIICDWHKEIISNCVVVRWSMYMVVNLFWYLHWHGRDIHSSRSPKPHEMETTVHISFEQTE